MHIKNKKINKKKLFILTKKEKCAINKEKKNYESTQAIIVEALKIVQKNRGWISNNAINAIAKILYLPSSDVESVATFYSNIYRNPVGRYVIKYCDSIVCYINGYEKILSFIKEYLKINPGNTTLNKKFTLLPTCCLGNCDKSPTIMINNITYENLNLKKIVKILKNINEKNY